MLFRSMKKRREVAESGNNFFSFTKKEDTLIRWYDREDLMGKYDTSWGQDMASPFIMENDELMDGWRPNPDRRSSAIG